MSQLQLHFPVVLEKYTQKPYQVPIV